MSKRSRKEEEEYLSGTMYLYVVHCYRDYRKENEGDVLGLFTRLESALRFRVEYIKTTYGLSEEDIPDDDGSGLT